MLQPIYEFLLKRDFSNCNTTFYHLLSDCFKQIEKTIENEIEFRQSDEAIIEEIEANEYDFLIDGKRY